MVMEEFRGWKHCWVNVFDEGGLGAYHSKEHADNLPSLYARIACLHIVQEYEEGEGL